MKDTYFNCTITTEQGKILYVESYKNSRSSIKYTLTENQDNAEIFWGQSSKVGGNPNSDNDIYGRTPNFTPFLSLRDILKCKELEYLRVKRINLEEFDFDNGQRLRKRNVPEYYKKYKGVYGKKVEIIDIPNNKTIAFTIPPQSEEDKLIQKFLMYNLCSCGHTFVLRDGPYGKFFGCKDYPHCKNTLSLEKGINIVAEQIKEEERRRKAFWD